MFWYVVVLLVILALIGFGALLGKHNQKKINAVEKTIKDVKDNFKDVK